MRIQVLQSNLFYDNREIRVYPVATEGVLLTEGGDIQERREQKS